MSTPVWIRPAVAADLDELRAVAVSAGSPDAEDGQLEFVAATGRLQVAASAVGLVGLAGALPVGGATFVSDLFVRPEWHGRGIGGLLLRALLVDEGPRVTFSSQHPAALHLYACHGLEHRGKVLYLGRSGVVRHVPDFVPLCDQLFDSGWTVLDADVVLATPGWEWPTGVEEVSPGRFWVDRPD